MTSQEQELRVFEVATEESTRLGLELVELKIGRHHKDVLIQIIADRPLGGMILEECANLNRRIVESIDKLAIFSEDGYSLEVSSPGLDRPLVTYKDFVRNTNAEIRLWLKDKFQEKKEYQGLIISASSDELVLFVTTKEKLELKIPFNLVQKGILII